MALARKDVAALMGCAMDIHDASIHADFPFRATLSLLKVIPADHTCFGLFDVPEGKASFYPSPFDPWPDLLTTSFPEFNYQHPALRPIIDNCRLDKAKDLPAVNSRFYKAIAQGKGVNCYSGYRKSDIQRLPLYNNLYRESRIKHEIGLHLFHNGGNSVSTAITREQCEFTEREIEMLNLIAPHLRKGYLAYANNHGIGPETSPILPKWPGIPHTIIAKINGNITLMHEKSQHLLQHYLPQIKGSRLPERARRWFVSQIKLQSEESFLMKGIRECGFTNAHGTLKLRLGPFTPDNQVIIYLDEYPAPSTRRLRVNPLTPREMEILHWVARGKSNKEIAHILSISAYTVHNHLNNIYSKLGTNNRTAAVAAADQLFS